jgi:hypothetical protein
MATAARTATCRKFVHLEGAQEAEQPRPGTKATEPSQPVQFRPVALDELKIGDRVWVDFDWKKERIICRATIKAPPGDGPMRQPSLGIRVEPEALGKAVTISRREVLGLVVEEVIKKKRGRPRPDSGSGKIPVK